MGSHTVGTRLSQHGIGVKSYEGIRDSVRIRNTLTWDEDFPPHSNFSVMTKCDPWSKNQHSQGVGSASAQRLDGQCFFLAEKSFCQLCLKFCVPQNWIDDCNLMLS